MLASNKKKKSSPITYCLNYFLWNVKITFKKICCVSFIYSDSNVTKWYKVISEYYFIRSGPVYTTCDVTWTALLAKVIPIV